MSWLGCITSWFRKTHKNNKPEPYFQQQSENEEHDAKIMRITCLIFKPLPLLHTVIVTTTSSLLVVGLEMTLAQQHLLRSGTCQCMRHMHHHMCHRLPLWQQNLQHQVMVRFIMTASQLRIHQDTRTTVTLVEGSTRRDILLSLTHHPADSQIVNIKHSPNVPQIDHTGSL